MHTCTLIGYNTKIGTVGVEWGWTTLKSIQEA